MGSEPAENAQSAARFPFARVWMVALVGLGVLAGLADAYLYAVGDGGADLLLAVWSVASLFLLALWIIEDSRNRPEVYKPYELGFFALLFWPAYVPYYFIRTRRWAGLLWLIGLLLLLQLGLLIKFVLYMAQ